MMCRKRNKKKQIDFQIPYKVLGSVVLVYVGILTLRYMYNHSANIVYHFVRQSNGQKTSHETVYLCSNTMGRLGNAMFTYASMLGVAKNKTMTPSFYPGKEPNLFTLFKHPRAAKLNKECNEYGFLRSGNAQHCAFNQIDVSFSNRFNTSMNGYYQSWVYFKNVFKEIRHEFRFKEEICNKAKVSIRRAVDDIKKSQKITYITVHVRRSDILESFFPRLYGYISPGVRYYIKAMNYFRRKYSNSVFIVCSDRIEWCKEHLNFSDVVFMEGNAAIVDMCVLSQGNHTIISVGTFGWWGAFLANGSTVVYKRQSREGSGLRKVFSQDLKDYFLPNWIIMDDA